MTTTRAHVYPCTCRGPIPEDPAGHGETAQGCPRHDSGPTGDDARADWLAEHDEGELAERNERRFVYLVEGELYVGTIADVAHALEEAHYAGLDVSRGVWTPSADNSDELEFRTISTRTVGDADDYATVLVEIPDFEGRAPFEATYRLDLRA